MSRQRLRRGWAGGLALLLGAAVAQAQEQPAPGMDAPQYSIERCCDLCSAAYDPAAYNTGFLESFLTLVQGHQGWLFRSKEDLRTHFGADADGYATLRQFVQTLERRGITLVMVVQPPRGLMQWAQLPPIERSRYQADMARLSYRMYLQRLREAGAVVPAFEQLVNDPQEEFYFRRDHHWTPSGARRAAALTAEAIRELPVFAELPRQQFKTERAGIMSKTGTLQRAARQICGFDFPDQYVDQFRTRSTGDGGDLLGDSTAPQIALAGTSNSDPAYNFPGFLQEALETEVLNVSIGGGGLDGALFDYMTSDEFRQSPPKVLIWELASYHNLNDQAFQRQLRPLAADGCRDQRALVSHRGEVKAGRNEVLFNGDGTVLPIKSKDLRVDMQFSDPAVTEIRTVIWYTNGRKETFKIERSKYVDTRGRFLFDLRDDGDWGDLTFLSMDLQFEQAPKPGTTVEADLCYRGGSGGEVPRSAS